MLQKYFVALVATNALVASAMAEDTGNELDTVVVMGTGQSRQVQTLSPENLETLPPGASLQKALNVMPGVNAQSVDPLGLNEQSLTISVRGFNTTHLGYTLDGMPLGDAAYNNYNGLTISRALTGENLGRADLSMGIGNLGVASTSNLGGAITYFSSDPASQLGVQASQTVGTDNGRRTYVRLDIGEHNGVSAYLSGQYAQSDLFVNQLAYATSFEKQFNGKLLYRFERGAITAFADLSRTSQANDFYMSKDALGRLGWDWGGYAPDWTKALSRAYCNPTTLVAARCDNSGPDTYADGSFTGGQVLRNDDLYYIALDLKPVEQLSLRAQVYHHKDKGAGNNWNYGYSFQGTAQQLPFVLRDTLYAIDRTGGLLSASWDVGSNRLQAGLWSEQNTSSAERYNYNNVTGPMSLDLFLGGQPDTGTFAQQTKWKTLQFYLQDTVRLLDERLAVDFGFKSTDSKSDAAALPGIAKTPILATSANQFATGSLQAKEGFLPQVGVRFNLTADQEVFASYAKNIAMFQGGFKLGPQAVSQAVWNSQGVPLKPESSKSIEGGYRWKREKLQASIAAYDVKFENRLLQYNPCNSRDPNGPTCGNRLYNVGGVDSRGVELALLWQPTPWLNWYNSASFNRSTYNDNYVQDGVLYQTAGKHQVDTPDRMFASVVKLKSGGWFASLQGKYTGTRYYTYTNDQGFGGFTTFDMGAGFEVGSVGRLRKAKISLNVTNLTGKRYVANLDNSVFAPVDAAGKVVVAHSSAPREAFLSGSLEF